MKLSTVVSSRATAAAVALIAGLGLSACGTSFSAQTNQQYQAGVGADHRDGDVEVLAAVIVVDDTGTGTLAATLINRSDVQQLTGVSAKTLDGEKLTATGTEPLDLPTHSAARLGTDDGLLVRVGTNLEAGRYAAVTFEFSDSDAIVVNVPVVAQSAQYADIVNGEPTADEADETNEEHADEAAEESAGH